MTKEELEKEAGEYAEKHAFRVPYDGSNKFYDDVDFKASKEGYLAGAEPREKQNERLSKEVDDLENMKATLESKIAELEAENERLKGDLELWESGACRATNLDKCDVVKELKAQIEKMKCWCNCKNYLSCLEECCRKNISFEKGICYNCKKWELRR